MDVSEIWLNFLISFVVVVGFGIIIYCTFTE